DPRQRQNLLARGGGTEADLGSPAIQAERAEHVDLGSLAVAGDMDIVDGEARARGDRLHDLRPLPAQIGAIGAGGGKEAGGSDRGGETGEDDIATDQTVEDSRRPPQPARQGMRGGDTAGPTARYRPQRRHEASSTIQLNSSPKSCPA